MTIRSRYLAIAALAALVALPCAPLHAQLAAGTVAPGPSLIMSARNVTAAEAAARGTARKDSTARPGDVVHYSMVFTNTTTGAIRNVLLENPVPAGLEYVGGTARSTRKDTGADFSADGGRTFARQPMETVMVDGRQVTRAIPAGRFTHVRWVIGGAVPAGATVTAEFAARVADGRRAASQDPHAPTRR